MKTLRPLRLFQKGWSCDNQCGSNCCSEVFFRLTSSNKDMYNTERKIVVEEGYADWEWVSFHRNLIVSRQGRYYTIEINSGMDATLIWNDLKGCWFLHIKDKCINLLPDNRCGIYDRRPNMCRITKCPVYDEDEEIRWYGRNGLLKDKVK